MRRWLPLLIVVLLTVGLAFFVHDLVRRIVVEPVVYVGWFGWLVLTNLPHWVFWTLLLLAGLFMASASIRRPPRVRHQAAEETVPDRGPVERWQRLFEQGEGSSTARQRLARELGRVRWIALYPDLPYNAQTFADEMSAAGPGSPRRLDEEMAAYFAGGLAATAPGAQARGWFRRRLPDELDLPKEQVVTHLEETLGTGI